MPTQQAPSTDKDSRPPSPATPLEADPPEASETLTPLTLQHTHPELAPAAPQAALEDWVTLATLALSLIIGAIIFLQFRERQHKQARPDSTTNNTEHESSDADFLTPMALPMPITMPLEHPDETEDSAASAPQHNLPTHEDAPLFLPAHFACSELFAQLITPLNLTPTEPQQWLPSHLWQQFELTKHSSTGNIAALQYAAPHDLDYIIILCQQQGAPEQDSNLLDAPAVDTKTKTKIKKNNSDKTRENEQAKTKLVLLFRSYRLTINPDPVNIYSHALDATAEGFHDTLLLYKNAEPAPLSIFQQFIADGVAIFESLAAPSNTDARTEWLER